MIRRICPEDAQAVAAICRDALGYRADAALIARRAEVLAADPYYFITVCVDELDGSVVGFMQAQRYDLLYGEDGYNIIALAVAPAAQGRGFGRQLLAALEEHARAQGCAFIRLNSRVERAEAHAFYEHLGYDCDKTQKRLIKRLRAV